MMRDLMEFIDETGPTRVIFGAGACTGTGAELDRLGIARAMVITTPPQADIAAEFARLIGARAGIVYPGAQPFTPTNVTDAALTAVSSVQADGLLAIGDDTAIGLGKAIALRTGLPLMVVPTNFTGAAAKPMLAETERRVRVIRRGIELLPKTVLYDPEFMASMPAEHVLPSAMGAIADAVEALATADHDTAGMAERAIRDIAVALRPLADDSNDLAAWGQTVRGAWAAGTSAGVVGAGLLDAVCHTLAVSFDLDPTDMRSAMAPYVAMNPVALERLESALDASDGISALQLLMDDVGLGFSLKEMGLTRTAIDRATEQIFRDPFNRDGGVTPGQIEALLQVAYDGARL